MSRPDLVGKRLAYIERQKKLHAEAVNVDVRVRAPEGTGPANRDGMPKLPIGQHVVSNWPVLDLGDVPDVSRSAWQLEITGDVHNPITLTWADFMALPQVDDVSDFHCVTTWSRFDNHWRGVRLRDLAELVVPTESARFAFFTGYDISPAPTCRIRRTCRWRARRKTTCCWCTRGKVSRCRASTAVQSASSRPSCTRGRARSGCGASSSSRATSRGFWEVRGYSNTAEPWLNDRYS